MKRKSIKKSSTFKIQAEKNVFKSYLESVQKCQTARDYPHLLDNIRKTSEIVYDFCYSYSEESPFLRGLNYNSKNYGFSILDNVVTYRQWIPAVSQVYLLGDFNQFNPKSHQLQEDQSQPGMWKIQMESNTHRINEESKLLLRVINKQGKQYQFCPPSCYITQGKYGIFSMNNGVPVTKHFKKPLNTILAYTIDFQTLPIEKGESFIEENAKTLQNFNVIILRNIFPKMGSLLDRSRLQLPRMKIFRDIVNKIKNQYGLKVILQWNLQAGKVKYTDNPVEENLLIKQQNNLYQYNLENNDVMAVYMANLAFYISYFAIDGYHFKHIDEFCQNQKGQILMKCINLLNQRLSEGGLTLASSKKQVPGLNQPILEGGLGFTFTYNYDTNLLLSQNHKELKEKFNKIFASSNCMSINFESLSESHFMNLFFAFFSSQKGVFCKGSFQKISEPLCKILSIRKKSELFEQKVKIEYISESEVIVRRGKTCILLNFSEEQKKFEIEQKEKMQLIYSSDEEKVTQEADFVILKNQSCCILEEQL